MIGMWNVESPFVFIWDQDVVGAIIKGINEEAAGVYNLAGDGTLSMKQLAKIMKKPYLPIPEFLLEAGLHIGRKFHLTEYGPEQLMFVKYRPVLSNKRLKSEFGYIPKKTSREVFDYYLGKNR